MKHLLIDCETTGLIQNHLRPLAKQPFIIEFCGIIFDNEGAELKELSFLCDPGFPIDSTIQRITGLKPSDLSGQPKFAAFVAEVCQLLEDADVLVAHNLSFDRSMLELEFRRANVMPVWPAKLCCTVEQTEHLVGHRLKLNDLHQRLFDEPFAGGHRARTDVLALSRCYFELLRRDEI